MPYANHRPSYAPGQELEVWNAAKDANGEVWVKDLDGNNVRVVWEPGAPRNGLWDMGHMPGREYRKLREQYLSHQIDLDDFLAEYRDPGNYQVEHPSVNRSRRNEGP